MDNSKKMAPKLKPFCFFILEKSRKLPKFLELNGKTHDTRYQKKLNGFI